MAPDDPVIVGTVYDPSDGTGATERAGLAPWPDVTHVLAELNDGLRSVVRERDALVADVHGRFLGHGLSRGDVAQASTRPADRDLWFCRLIEPNAWGAGGVRAAFFEAAQRWVTPTTDSAASA
jgi:hypothetical protein